MNKHELFPEGLPLTICYPEEIPHGVVLTKGIITLIVKYPELLREFTDLKLEQIIFQEAEEFEIYTLKIIEAEELLLIRANNTYTILLSSEL